MDVEKTMQFILEQQAAFAANLEAERAERVANLEAERAERVESDRKTGERLDTLTSAIASLVLNAQAQQASIDSLVLNAQAHQASLDNFDAKWRDFLERFDRFLRGQGGGDGKA